MSAPQLTVYANGKGVVNGDQLDTFVQSCNTIADLRAFVGVVGVQVDIRGTNSVGDGGAGSFYWNATSTGPDDGQNVIVPPAASVGAWIRLLNFPYLTAIIEHTVDGGGTTPTVGISGDVLVPFSCTITGWTIQSTITGSIVWDVWAAGFANNTPPTVANSIVATFPPTLSSSQGTQTSTLTNWTTLINANTWMRFNINSVSTLQRATLSLTVRTPGLPGL
jgi:hypothetical protein